MDIYELAACSSSRIDKLKEKKELNRRIEIFVEDGCENETTRNGKGIVTLLGL